MSSDTVLRVVGVMAALRGPTPQPVKTKAPGDSRRLSLKYFGLSIRRVVQTSLVCGSAAGGRWRDGDVPACRDRVHLAADKIHSRSRECVCRHSCIARADIVYA